MANNNRINWFSDKPGFKHGLAWIVGIVGIVAVFSIAYQQFSSRPPSSTNCFTHEAMDIDNVANRSATEVIDKLGQPLETISRSIALDDADEGMSLRPTLELHYSNGYVFEFNYKGRMLAIRRGHNLLWP